MQGHHGEQGSDKSGETEKIVRYQKLRLGRTGRSEIGRESPAGQDIVEEDVIGRNTTL